MKNIEYRMKNDEVIFCKGVTLTKTRFNLQQHLQIRAEYSPPAF